MTNRENDLKIKLLLVSLLLITSTVWNQTLINTNSLPGSVGLELLTDDYGHLTRISSGTIAGDNFLQSIGRTTEAISLNLTPVYR